MPGFFFVSRSGGTNLPSPDRSGAGELHVRAGVVPLAELVAVAECLVDDELSVVAERDLHAFERTRRRAFEVHAILRVARPVARALELVLRSQPTRRAAQMRADAEQRVDGGARPHDRDALALHPLFRDISERILSGAAAFEPRG